VGVSSRELEVGGGEGAVVDGDGSADDTLGVRGDAVDVASRDFGNEAVASELGDEPAGALAAALGLGGVTWRVVVEASPQVAVGEPVDKVLTGQGGSGRWRGLP